MIRVSFHNPADLEDSQLLFAVIAARFQGKWHYLFYKGTEVSP